MEIWKDNSDMVTIIYVLAVVAYINNLTVSFGNINK